jgi:hypothetical protein
MIGSLRDGGCTGLEFYDKLNILVWGHSRKIVWKDIWVFTNYEWYQSQKEQSRVGG